jgi:hypothetical protein
MGELDRFTPSDGTETVGVEPTPIFDALVRAVTATIAEQPNARVEPETAPI